MDFRLLGPLEVFEDGRPLALGRGKHRALLAILLLHANEAVPTSRLIDELWAEAPPPTAAKIIRNYVSLLRKTLGEELLETSAAGYRLALGGATLDRDRFERLIALGRSTLVEGDATRAAALLREALALWRGPPLADFTYETFAQQEIARLEELRLGALEERIEADLRCGRDAELVPELESLVAEHPLRERLREQLMLALYRSGRQAEALAAYQDARRALVSELGLAPGHGLQELERRILAQDAALEPPPVAPPRSQAAATRSRRGGLLIALGGGVLLAAAIAATVLTLRGGSSGLANVEPNSLARIDPRTNRVKAEIPVGERPAAVLPAYGSLWVANLDDATVTRVDANRGRIVKTISTVAAPTGLAAGAGSLWTVGADGILRRIDPRFGAVVENVHTFRPASLLVGGPAAGAVAFGDGAVWVVSGGYGAAPRVSRVDPHSNRVVDKLVTGNAPTSVATGMGSTWVVDGFENSVTRLDSNAVVIASIQLGSIGEGAGAIAVGAGAVWVTEPLDDTVVRIDPKRNAVATTIRVGHFPTSVAVGAGGVWVTNAHEGTVSRVDPRRNREVKKIKVGSSPTGVAVAQGSVWVTTQVAPTSTVVAGGGTLRVAYDSPQDPPTDPALYPESTISYPTCAKLLNYADQPGPLGAQLVPEVARSLPRVSADGRMYTFTIRTGFRFSPPLREEVSAATFKHTIERSLDPRMHSLAPAYVDDIVGEAAFLRGKAPHIAGVVAQGDTLTIRLARRSPSFPARIAMPLFCAVPMTTPPDPKGVRAIPSAGPYYISSFAPHQQLVLRRNPNYGGSRPHRFSRIVYTLGISPAKALADVEAGVADYLPRIPFDADARLAARYGPTSGAAGRHQRYFVAPRLNLAFLALNTSRPLFASARLRRAVSYAIDRRALARQGSLLYGPGPFTTIPTDRYLPPNMPGSDRRNILPLEGDPAAARRVAGAVHATAVLYSCNLALCRRHEQQITHDLSAIGIDVDVKEFPLEHLIERASRPNEPYDILIAWWYVDYADPADVLNILLDPHGNLSHFRSKRWDDELARVDQIAGQARYRSYAQLARKLERDVSPVIAYATGTTREFFSARVGCQAFNPVYGLDLAALCLRRVRPTRR
jgi:YVTN family beta-propeller protein